jgi:quercetin dioxygenase-like cupin family protein
MLGQGRIRRVVTGHDERGKSIVVSDGFAPAVRTSAARPGHHSTEIWKTSGAPAPVGNEPDPTIGPRQLKPPKHGTVIRVSEMPPDSAAVSNFDAAAATKIFESMGQVDASTFREGGRHPLMHRTETIDYGIVLSGELTLILDDSEVQLNAGDMVIQRGTNHAWSNRSDKPCIIAFILVDGEFEPGLKQKPDSH